MVKILAHDGQDHFEEAAQQTTASNELLIPALIGAGILFLVLFIVLLIARRRG